MAKIIILWLKPVTVVLFHTLLFLLLLALQPAVGFGLSNNTSPFFPILHQLSPSSHSQHLKISFYFLLDSIHSTTLRRRDLNAPCSGCLPEFFLEFFKFQCMLLEKKSYLIDFSFKFNAIKFGNLLMNWFIREKMFAYCYNKFRPLNRIHYVKCSVNSLLLTKFWLLQKVCGTLDHYFTTTHNYYQF